MENKMENEAVERAPSKKRKLSKKIRDLAKTGRISPKQISKLRGSDVPKHKPRGGTGRGMAGH